MKKCILVIGVRRGCYQAALKLGHDVILWSDKKLNPKRKKDLLGFIEESYSENFKGLSPSVINKLKEFKIDRVVSNTEETVMLGAFVREHLGLKRLAADITNRFHSKLVMKDFAMKCDVPITKYKIVDDKTSAEDLVNYLGFPVVLKPVDDSGARDVKIATMLSEVEEFMKPGLLAESFVKGREVSVETFVKDGVPIFHNITEYLHQWRKSAVPAKLDPDLKAKIFALNDKVVKDFGVDRGMTHAEFYLTDDGPVFGEIAIRPPGGYYMELISKTYGFNAWELYINICCGDNTDYQSIKEDGCSGVFIIHPGDGVIKTIDGVDKIKEELQGIFEFSMRVEVGDTILPHETTSNEVGHILFWSPSRDQLDIDFAYIESHLKFEFE
jgi:biotin carboxylase